MSPSAFRVLPVPSVDGHRGMFDLRFARVISNRPALNASLSVTRESYAGTWISATQTGLSAYLTHDPTETLWFREFPQTQSEVRGYPIARVVDLDHGSVFISIEY